LLLNCHTYYSLCYGTLSVEELIADLSKKNYNSFVLSDINNTSAILDALRLSQNTNLKIIPGIDFRNGVQQQYIGIAKNNLGFKEINLHLSEHLHQGKNFESAAPQFENAFVIYPFSSYKQQKNSTIFHFLNIKI
jgi:DNA polymerase-3 subunit alpha